MATDICNCLIHEERARPSWKLAIYESDGAIGSLILGRTVPKVAGARLLNLGCGPLYYPGWINADYCSLIRLLRQRDFRPDWQLDVTKRWKAPDSYFDGIFAQHVINALYYMDAIFVLDECFRTLKPGAWLRISVPNLDKYIDYKAFNDNYAGMYVCRPKAISFITQFQGRNSLWDSKLMIQVLTERGFVNVRETEFGVGTNTRLAEKDQEVKRRESLYVEAQKPLQ
jgi:predicted SAM-dependent methyltransferase